MLLSVLTVVLLPLHCRTRGRCEKQGSPPSTAPAPACRRQHWT